MILTGLQSANELAFVIVPQSRPRGTHRVLRCDLRAELVSREHIHLSIYQWGPRCATLGARKTAEAPASGRRCRKAI